MMRKKRETVFVALERKGNNGMSMKMLSAGIWSRPFHSHYILYIRISRTPKNMIMTAIING